ncbi:RsmB/NOP family class I SAM-dependent RNA methyltransferase [Paenibacillus flagellatus]|uniref:RNA methyltransferase n=1 Tax=Paenibacillus flagellatus TaxID=2211139 RepID=A0A2V5KBW6_9BACL|nr:RsmB/NOP family class I SAM-dependent RNA methyltransferase [Paenibacillus flagellatus]PYI56482.1 RNA methyltransferase [Paenibacillus flagellatus]
MIELPQRFIERIREQLGPEAEAFIGTYDEPRTQGLRLNPLKLGGPATGANGHESFRDELIRRFGLTPVPWCRDGYYYDEATKPGKHPYHQAGLYYIQEPSAMSAAELLDVQPGELVLDLAAAPGGKTTQIAGALAGRGLLVSNDIHPARAKILSENVERFGIANAVVTNASPDELAAKFSGAFDKIMLDAPCSGEGMFRKDPEAILEWSPDHVRMCAARQLDILDSAARLLKPGGTLAYSTCTFNREENEEALERFVERYPAFSVVRTERIWPHRHKGEGHFVALLRRQTDEEPASTAATSGRRDERCRRTDPADRSVREAMKLAEAMLRDVVPGFDLPAGEPVLFGEQLYWLPSVPGFPLRARDLNGLRTLRPGLHLAHVKKDRAEPAHSLAMAISTRQARSVASFDADGPEAGAYWRGETVPAPDGVNGWTAVAVDGYPIGWAKASGGQLKNHLPKGLRRPG